MRPLVRNIGNDVEAIKPHPDNSQREAQQPLKERHHEYQKEAELGRHPPPVAALRVGLYLPPEDGVCSPDQEDGRGEVEGFPEGGEEDVAEDDGALVKV